MLRHGLVKLLAPSFGLQPSFSSIFTLFAASFDFTTFSLYNINNFKINTTYFRDRAKFRRYFHLVKMDEQQFAKDRTGEQKMPQPSTSKPPAVARESSSQGSAPARKVLKPVPKTRLGRYIRSLFQVSTLASLMACGVGATMWRDDLVSNPSRLILGTSAFYRIYVCSGFLGAITFAIDARSSQLHLPQLLYASIVLHHEQRRSGRTHRAAILPAKILAFLVSVAVLVQCCLMPATHRADLLGDIDFLRKPNLSRSTMAVVYATTCYDAVGIVWGLAATPILVWTVVMDFLLCFAWSPTPEMFTLEELRRMKAMEEARKDEPLDSSEDTTPSFIWRWQKWAADLGENMASFAYRQFEMVRQ